MCHLNCQQSLIVLAVKYLRRGTAGGGKHASVNSTSIISQHLGERRRCARKLVTLTLHHIYKLAYRNQLWQMARNIDGASWRL